MTINEVAHLLGYSTEKVETLMATGLTLPKSGRIVKLHATRHGTHVDIIESDFDHFVLTFEGEEPGRWPPAAVRRSLLVEAKHRCAICGGGPPLQFHHMLDWAKITHHDPQHMLAVCGTCHDRCTNGFIDHKSQMSYKKGLGNESPHSHSSTSTYRRVEDCEFRQWLTIGERVVLRALTEEFGCEVRTNVKVTAGDGWLVLDAAVVRGEDLLAIEVHEYKGGGFPYYQIEHLAQVGSQIRLDRFQKFLLLVAVVSEVDPQLDESVRVGLENLVASAGCEVQIRMYRLRPLRARYSM